MDERPLLWIEWVDSVGSGVVWTLLEDAPMGDKMGVTSIGWLICETPESITIAAHFGAVGVVSGDMTIPKCAIKGRWELSV